MQLQGKVKVVVSVVSGLSFGKLLCTEIVLISALAISVGMLKKYMRPIKVPCIICFVFLYCFIVCLWRTFFLAVKLGLNCAGNNL